MQAIIDACAQGRIHAEVSVVISNNSRSGALARARTHGIPTAHLSAVTHPVPDDLDRAIMETLDGHGVKVVALAGYMKRLGPLALSCYKDHLLNTHPALLPKFGGQGMYGDKVHEAVLASRERVSGSTVHMVEDDYDMGQILSQVEVPVRDWDTLETLRDRVQAKERQHYVTVLERIATRGIHETLAAAQRRHAADETAQPFAVAVQKRLVRRERIAAVPSQR